MENDNIEDISSHPFFVRAEFPFLFIPTTSTTGFTFANSHTHDDADQTTTEFINEKEKTEDEKEIIDDDVDHSDENGNDSDVEKKIHLRISQPKYSQLLKDLDFSHGRMVDVTNLLSDGGSYFTPDENENPKKTSNHEKYQSLSSSRSSSISSNEAIAHPSSSNNENLTSTDYDLNNLATIIQEASQNPNKEHDNDKYTQKKHSLEEDDDTSKQATQNYDLNDNEQEDIVTSSKSNKTIRFTTQNSNNIQDDNISSIPRLNQNTNNRTENIDQTQEYPINWENLVNGTDAFIQQPTILIFSQPINDIPTTPVKQEEQQPLSSPKEKLSKQKIHHRLRQLSTSSDTDSTSEYDVHRSKQTQHSTSQPQLSIDEDLNDLNTHLKQVLTDQDQPYTTASDILIRRLSNQQTDRPSPNKKKSHYHRSATDTWLSMLEKLEREHKERLDKQQKQYEDYMHNLEENLKRRFDEYLSTTNSLQESKSEKLNESMRSHHIQNSVPNDSNTETYRNYQYRPLAKNYYSDKRQTIGTNLSRSHSREDISSLRSELSAKHEKHISDLKLYYDHELDELKNQLNRSKMGHTSSTTRQSMETIERINSENIRLHDEMKEMRHSLKTIEEENQSLKRQIDELRDQLNNKDIELKNYHRSINEFERQLSEAQNIKERQDEKIRHADRQALFYREENEKLTNELNIARERLLRLETRQPEFENHNKTFRPQGFISENNTQRVVDDLKFNSTMALNMPTSREYGRFTLTTAKYSSSTISTPRDANFDSGRYTTNGTDDLFRHDNSPRPLTRISDYINEKPIFPQTYIPPSRPFYSPRKPSPNHRRNDPMPDLVDNQIKQSEQLEAKFDELLQKKRDLESRMNRIPTRNLTSTDRQLLDVLEREIERVEQQISSVKLELRKMNIIRTH